MANEVDHIRVTQQVALTVGVHYNMHVSLAMVHMHVTVAGLELDKWYYIHWDSDVDAWNVDDVDAAAGLLSRVLGYESSDELGRVLARFAAYRTINETDEGAREHHAKWSKFAALAGKARRWETTMRYGKASGDFERTWAARCATVYKAQGGK